MKGIRGFSLLELMVVVAIIAILAGIGISSYGKQIRKSHRAEAKQILSEVALRQEKWRTNNATYLGTNSSAANRTLFGVPASGALVVNTGEFYTVTITTAESGTAFTIRATPTGDQVNDSCGTLQYQVSGTTVTKTPTDCW